MKDDLSDFALPAPKGRRKGSPTGWMIAHGIAWALPLVVITFVTPRFAPLFRDFNVDLPRSTTLLLKVAAAGPIPWLLFLASLLVADWSLLGVDLATAKSEPQRPAAWAIVMIVVPVLLFMAMIVALYVPLEMTLHRLSG